MERVTRIARGVRVHCILYGGRDGIIYHVTGEPAPASVQRLGGGVAIGGRASADVVFDNGHISRGIPEGIIYGVQWFARPGIASDAEIEAALAHAEEVKRQEEAQAAKAAEERRQERARIERDYPHLEKAEGSKHTRYAVGAANIRKELKAAFPGCTFRVTSKGYSMGCEINIHWTDGPTEAEVRAITDKYQTDDFNGMEDISEARHSIWPEVYGGAKHVIENRHLSAAVVQAVAVEYGWPVTVKGDSVEAEDWDKTRRLYREAGERSYYVRPASPPKPARPFTTPAPVTVDRPTMAINEKRHGVEIHFPSKPAPAVLDSLKAAGWRWSRFAGCWYMPDSSEAREFASRLTA